MCFMCYGAKIKSAMVPSEMIDWKFFSSFPRCLGDINGLQTHGYGDITSMSFIKKSELIVMW